ncbi:MAG: hypothetical protein IH914_02165 [candidate division Zixibacteria bacterium]|nr:hypothetical protein [candidate division Zixibacteria bacterium]
MQQLHWAEVLSFSFSHYIFSGRGPESGDYIAAVFATVFATVFPSGAVRVTYWNSKALGRTING